MINKIYTYGDSFSYKYWMEEEDTYTYKLSKKLKVSYENRAFPALCHHEIFQRLLKDLLLFKENDLIIYQFTAGSREGYVIDKETYYSSAGLSASIDETVDIMNRWGGGRHKYPMTDQDMSLLWNYLDRWGDKTLHYKYNRVLDLLSFLAKEKGIKFIFTHLDFDFDKYKTEYDVVFPISKYPNNISIMDWAIENKLRLGDIRDLSGIHPEDAHPNRKGHTQISEIIHNHLIKNQYI
jgi:hypothetical protein